MRVIYDTTGKIIKFEDDYNGDAPVGVPSLLVQDINGKVIVGVDVSVEPHKAIYSNLDKPPMIVLEERQIETEIDVDYRLSLLELGL